MILFYSWSDPLPKALSMKLQSVAEVWWGEEGEGGDVGVVCMALWVRASHMYFLLGALMEE